MNNSNPSTSENPQFFEKTPSKAEGLGFLIAPTLIYTILTTFFIYRNLSGITMPLFSLATIVYCLYCIKRFDINLKKDSYLYAAAILLLGVSSFMTGSTLIITVNFLVILFLTLCMLLHNFFDDSRWDLGKYIWSILELMVGALLHIPAPFADIAYIEKNKKEKTKGLYVIIGLAISFPLLIIIISLLYSADAVFADVIKNIFKDISLLNIIGIVFTFIFAFMAAYCSLRFLGKRQISEAVKDRRSLEPIIAITVLSLISVVYLLFSLIQIVYLFIGNMKLPDGYTYASYAHEGFFQLLFVCILNVLIVIFVMRFFKKSIVVKILLTLISLCTYIMIASSGLRMWLYVKTYCLSVLRLLVFWGLAVLSVLLIGILIQIVKEDFRLFKYSLFTVCLLYMVLSFGHIDYWIARFNLEYVAEKQGDVDYDYLTKLSSDAASVISKYEGTWTSVYAHRQLKYQDDGIRRFNMSHYNALKAFSTYSSVHANDYMVLINRFDNTDSAISDHLVNAYKTENISQITCAYSTTSEGDNYKAGTTVFERYDDIFIAYIPESFFENYPKGIDLSIHVTYKNGTTLESDHFCMTPDKAEIIKANLERYDNNLYFSYNY